MRPIEGDHLVLAAHAHIERTRTFGPQPIDRIVESLHVDAKEFGVCLRALGDERAIDGDDKLAWAAGAIDGFVLGVRAARIAEGVA
jgi:hypothetical protein